MCSFCVGGNARPVRYAFKLGALEMAFNMDPRRIGPQGTMALAMCSVHKVEMDALYAFEFPRRSHDMPTCEIADVMWADFGLDDEDVNAIMVSREVVDAAFALFNNRFGGRQIRGKLERQRHAECQELVTRKLELKALAEKFEASQATAPKSSANTRHVESKSTPKPAQQKPAAEASALKPSQEKKPPADRSAPNYGACKVERKVRGSKKPDPMHKARRGAVVPGVGKHSKAAATKKK